MRRGMSAGAAIFLVVFFGVLIYLVWSFGSVWFTKKWLTGKVRDTIQTRFFEMPVWLIEDIVTYGKERGIVILPAKVVITRPHKDSMKVAVEYDDAVETPLFRKDYIIKIEVTEGTGGG